ncbi:hypothetical protein JVT61DRAFT_7915 [Boletus reticuloceps]|uniref:Uncharacterized protein n=1 Tax=Boletus reticuloceps TaxID=495285 RepID=A0A8I2YI10_9AGAM|nr:hypothetical protein JVT61DRAFT_7915 [Boletus reticuloceps]
MKGQLRKQMTAVTMLLCNPQQGARKLCNPPQQISRWVLPWKVLIPGSCSSITHQLAISSSELSSFRTVMLHPSNTFPLRTDFNTKAIEYIDEVIAEQCSQGLLVSEVIFIACQLWEDLRNWQSVLRKKAQTYVAQCYQWDPENCREQNILIVKGLLDGSGLFLRDGTDDQVPDYTQEDMSITSPIPPSLDSSSIFFTLALHLSASCFPKYFPTKFLE